MSSEINNLKLKTENHGIRRVCSYCEREQGMAAQEGDTHGICPRHFWEQMRSAGANDAHIIQQIIERKLYRRPIMDLGNPSLSRAIEALTILAEWQDGHDTWNEVQVPDSAVLARQTLIEIFTRVPADKNATEGADGAQRTNLTTVAV